MKAIEWLNKLKDFPLSLNQKLRLKKLINEEGGGNGIVYNDFYVDYKKDTITFNGVEYTMFPNVNYSNGLQLLYICSTKLYNNIKQNYNNNNRVAIDIDGALMYINMTSKALADEAILINGIEQNVNDPIPNVNIISLYIVNSDDTTGAEKIINETRFKTEFYLRKTSSSYEFVYQNQSFSCTRTVSGGSISEFTLTNANLCKTFRNIIYAGTPIYVIVHVNDLIDEQYNYPTSYKVLINTTFNGNDNYVRLEGNFFTTHLIRFIINKA